MRSSDPLPIPSALTVPKPAARVPVWRAPAVRRAGQWAIRGAFAAGLIAVGVVSLLPAERLPAVDASDKLEHFFCYAVIAANGALVFRGGRARLWLGGALFVFGAAMEGLQALAPGRQSSLADALANGAGIIAGLAAVAGLAALLRILKRGAEVSPPQR
jgi:VanZ family protein